MARESLSQQSSTEKQGKLFSHFQLASEFQADLQTRLLDCSPEEIASGRRTESILHLPTRSLLLQQGLEKYVNAERIVQQWYDKANTGDSLVGQKILQQLFPHEDFSLHAEAIHVERIHGGIAFILPQELFQKKIIAGMVTGQGNVTREEEIVDTLDSYASVGFLLDQSELQEASLSPELKQNLRVVFIKQGTQSGVERALEHEKREILSSYFMESPIARGTQSEKVAESLHDFAARLETGENIAFITLGSLGILPEDFVDSQSQREVKTILAILQNVKKQLERFSTQTAEEGSYEERMLLARQIRAGALKPENLLRLWGKDPQEEMQAISLDDPNSLCFGENKESVVFVAKKKGRFVYAKPSLRPPKSGESFRNGVNGIEIGNARYKVVKEIAQGGFGVVYKGEKIRGEGPSTVAIKEILSNLAEIVAFSDISPEQLIQNWKQLHPQGTVDGFITFLYSRIRDARNGSAQLNWNKKELEKQLHKYVDDAIQKYGKTFQAVAKAIEEFRASSDGEHERISIHKRIVGFQREYYILKMLHGKKGVPRVYGDIVGIHDKYSNNGSVNALYFVEEFIEGDTLSKIGRSHEVSDQEYIEYLIEVLDILDMLHEEYGIIYVDLSPKNIMLRPSGSRRGKELIATLIDFGGCEVKRDRKPGTGEYRKGYQRLLAMGVPEQVIQEHVSTVTPAYSAPEIVPGEGKKPFYSRTADVYAIGRMLVKWLDQKDNIINAIIKKATDKNYKNRYKAREMRDALIGYYKKRWKSSPPDEVLNAA